MASGIKTVYAMFNGQKVNATYDETTKKYTVETTAPAYTSWNQPDHVYTMTLHAEDVAGNTVEMTSSDATYGSQLKFRVLEKVKPVVEVTSPGENAVLGSSSVTVDIAVTNERSSSTLNFNSIVFKVDGVAKPAEEIRLYGTPNEDGSETYSGSVDLTGLSDGAHKIQFQISDNDGNTSLEAVRNFIVSTAAPTLNVTSPTDNLVTNATKITVRGTASSSSYTSLASVKVNNAVVTVGSDGTFSKEVTLSEGSNTITVVATDSIGKSTSITRTVVFDSHAPVISDVVAEAVTVNASGKIKVTFKVIDQ